MTILFEFRETPKFLPLFLGLESRKGVNVGKLTRKSVWSRLSTLELPFQHQSGNVAAEVTVEARKLVSRCRKRLKVQF